MGQLATKYRRQLKALIASMSLLIYDADGNDKALHVQSSRALSHTQRLSTTTFATKRVTRIGKDGGGRERESTDNMSRDLYE